ncbi:sulfotransferase 4A1 [Papio anubis]|uniref:sulfotransferase 4A1 n=1 Tax=Papio anubis TaxID=9555 RepID=UPI0012AE3D9F|nr:sulfotransferase 4A1 [Papio anubis]
MSLGEAPFRDAARSLISKDKDPLTAAVPSCWLDGPHEEEQVWGRSQCLLPLGRSREERACPMRPTVRTAGTSLLQEVVYLVSQGADPDEIGLMNIDEQLPVLEYPQPGLDIIKELTSPRLIKSHLPYRFLPSDLHNGDSKVIYMARNPKDLVVSYYQFHRSLRTMSYRGTFQEFCRRFMNDKLGYGSWFEHVQEFWEHRMDSNVLFLKYEDMHRDLVTMVEQLARFLGVSCDKTQLEALTEHCHQLVDQCCNAEALPVGRGRVGLWKDIFTVSMNEKFDLVYKQKMGKCDLTFDFYL